MAERAGIAARVVGRLKDFSLTATLVAAILLLAEVSASRQWISPFIVPAPTDVWTAFWDGVDRGIYWPHIRSTVSAMAVGFALASVGSIALAAVLVSFRALERAVTPIIVAFQALPKVAVAPLVLIWLGFEQQAKVAIVTVVTFFPILVNAMQGLRARDREQWELFRSLGASRLQAVRYLRLPTALPYIFAGLNIGAVFALIGAVVAELVGTRNGLGYLLMIERANFNAPGAYAILFILMAIGVLLQRAVAFAERRTIFWAADLTQQPVPGGNRRARSRAGEVATS
ncbi:MAG: ABC transporter permease [Acidimicrobiia bacterium]